MFVYCTCSAAYNMYIAKMRRDALQYTHLDRPAMNVTAQPNKALHVCHKVMAVQVSYITSS